MDTLRRGNRGDEVKILQSYLHLIQDGIFGAVTEEAVKAFQKSHGLMADGIVGRMTWEALKSRETSLKKTKREIRKIILHCTATPEGRDVSIDDIRKMHHERGWSDIGYHYIIDINGNLRFGRNIDIVGAHCVGHNTYSIGIAYVGGVLADGVTPKDTRTEKQKETMRDLIENLLAMYSLSIENVHCHNEFASKACPSFSIEDYKKEWKEVHHV